MRETDTFPVQICPFLQEKTYLIPSESETRLDSPRSEFWNVSDEKNPLTKSDLFVNFEWELKHFKRKRVEK